MTFARTILVAAVAGAILAVASLAPSSDALTGSRGHLGHHGARQQDQSIDRDSRGQRQSARRWQHRSGQGSRKHWWFSSAMTDEVLAHKGEQAMTAVEPRQS